MAMSAYRRLRVGLGTAGASDQFEGQISPEGDSNWALVAGSIKLYSVTLNTSLEYGEGTLVATDNGSGGFTPEGGHYLGTATINMTTGIFDINEDGSHDEWSASDYLAIDYQIKHASYADDWDWQFKTSAVETVTPKWVRERHSNLSAAVSNYGTWCGRIYGDADDKFSNTGVLFLRKGSTWDTNDSVSIRCIRRNRTDHNIPVTALVTRYVDDTHYYAFGVHDSDTYFLTGGLNAPAYNFSANYSVRVTVGSGFSHNIWHALRLDTMVEAPDIRIKAYALPGTTEVDNLANDSSLWVMILDCKHESGSTTPNVIYPTSGVTTNVFGHTTPYAYPPTTGKSGFAVGYNAIATGNNYFAYVDAVKLLVMP